MASNYADKVAVLRKLTAILDNNEVPCAPGAVPFEFADGRLGGGLAPFDSRERHDFAAEDGLTRTRRTLQTIR